MSRDIFQARREAFLERLGQGTAILFANPVRVRNADVTYPYRQDSDFYYLTGFEEPEAVAVFCPEHAEHRFVLFVRARDPEREVWDGPRAGVEGAVERYGADAAFTVSDLEEKLPGYLVNVDSIWHRIGLDPSRDGQVVSMLQRARVATRKEGRAPTRIAELGSVLHEMRLLKSPDELALLRRAIEISSGAHQKVREAARPGMNEQQLQALLEYEFLAGGAARCGYASIVASGPSATVLHYTANCRTVQPGDLILIDAGAEYEYYSADITRTFPVDGTLTPPQKAVWDLVATVQEEVIAAVRPGATHKELQALAVRRLTEGMVELRLLEGDIDQLIEEKKYMPYYMHGIGHWLGMDVHDAGRYELAGGPRPLAAGMVTTIEPGLYIPETAESAPAELRGIGVRIEDDVLVTPDGNEVLSAACPK